MQLRHTREECTGTWEIAAAEGQQTVRCDRCLAQHSATIDARLALFDETLARLRIERLAWEGRRFLDPR
jgi:hypothetical protein